VCAKDIASNGEAQAAVAGVGFEEGIEELRKVGRTEGRASVIDEEFDAAAGARFCAEVDDIARGRPVDGMREDLGEGGAGFGLVDKSRKFGGRSDGKFDVAGGSGFRSRGGDGAQGVSKIGKGAIDFGRLGIKDKVGNQGFEASRFLGDGVEERIPLGCGEILCPREREGTGDEHERGANLAGDRGRAASDDGELLFLEEMGAGAGKLFERIGEEEFLAVKIVDENPDHETRNGVDEADGGGFNVLVDIDGARVQVKVLIEPEEIKEVSEEDDGESAKKRIAESRLEDGNGHQYVVLAVAAVGGGSGEGKGGADEDGDGGEAEERLLSTDFANEQPTKKNQITVETGTHDEEEERSNGPPNVGEESVGKDKGEDDEEVENAEDHFLQTGILHNGCVPEREELSHRRKARAAHSVRERVRRE